MISYSIVDSNGKVIDGKKTIKTPEKEIYEAISLKKSVVYSHISSFEILLPVGSEIAIIYHVRKLHLGFLLRVLSFYSIGWASWMIAFDGIEEMIFYEGIKKFMGAPSNDALFYFVIVVLGVISLLTSSAGRYRIIGFNIQAAWWFALTSFFAQSGPNTAIFIYGSFFVFSMYGAYLTIIDD